jgi:hypothetical protein
LVSSCTTAPSSGRRSTSRGRPGDRVGEADDAGLGVRFDGPSPAGSPGEARHQAGGEQQRDRDHLGDRVDPQGVVGSGQEEVVGQGGRECRDEPGGPATDARNVTPAGPWGPCRPAGPWLPRSRARALAEMSTTPIERYGSLETRHPRSAARTHRPQAHGHLRGPTLLRGGRSAA